MTFHPPGGGGSGSGDVVGPASSTDNAIVRFNGATGKLIQDSSNAILDDNANLTLSVPGGVQETKAGINLSHTNGTGTSQYRISQDEGDYLQIKRTGDTTGDGDVYTIVNLVSPQAATTADSEATLSLTSRAGGGAGLNETMTLDVYNDQYSRDNGMGMRQLYKNLSANPIRFEMHDKTTNNGATTYSGCTITATQFTFVYTSFAGVTPTVGDWVWDNAGTYFADDTKITAVDLGTKTITFNRAAIGSGSGLSFRGKNIKEIMRLTPDLQLLVRKFIADSSSTVAEFGGDVVIDGSLSVGGRAIGNLAVVTTTEVTGTSQSAAVNSWYIANNASLVTVTLPTTAALGDVVRVIGKGAGGWKVAQNASEIIHFGNQNTTTGTGGSLASTNRYDVVELVCTVADTEWTVVSSIGNLTVV